MIHSIARAVSYFRTKKSPVVGASRYRTPTPLLTFSFGLIALALCDGMARLFDFNIFHNDLAFLAVMCLTIAIGLALEDAVVSRSEKVAIVRLKRTDIAVVILLFTVTVIAFVFLLSGNSNIPV